MLPSPGSLTLTVSRWENCWRRLPRTAWDSVDRVRARHLHDVDAWQVVEDRGRYLHDELGDAQHDPILLVIACVGADDGRAWHAVLVRGRVLWMQVRSILGVS